MERYTALLHHHLLLPSDTVSAAGVAYHVSDLLVGELRGAVGDKGGPVPGAALEALLLPFVEALRVGEQVALHRIRWVLHGTMVGLGVGWRVHTACGRDCTACAYLPWRRVCGLRFEPEEGVRRAGGMRGRGPCGGGGHAGEGSR